LGEFCIKVDIFDGSITAQWAKIGFKEKFKFTIKECVSSSVKNSEMERVY